MKVNVTFTDTEVRYLVALLKGEAARQSSNFERRAQVEAELIIGKLEGRYK